MLILEDVIDDGHVLHREAKACWSLSEQLRVGSYGLQVVASVYVQHAHMCMI